MDAEQILALMKGVSDNGITDFSYDADGVKLCIKKHPEKKVMAPIQQMPAEPLYETNLERKESASSVASGKIVKSPLVGTFYCAGNPEEEPFVKVGDTVRKGQTLAIVEAMKLMNEIESDFDGVVTQILVNNGDLVEYDQPMFVIQ